MTRQLLKESFGWGFLLWLIGYILGFILFFVVPPGLIGLVIMPIGIILTLWVLFKKIKSTSMQQFFIIGFVWTLLAIILDYIFLVKLLKPADGYYKLDVYFYYVITFLLPLFVGWRKKK